MGRLVIHGMSRTPIYKVWEGMIRRCGNNKHSGFKNYGGRGIVVCDEWQVSSNFFQWALSNGYKEGLQIDRENNDAGYNPTNCRFVTRLVNVQNRRLLFENNSSGYRGVSKCKNGKFQAYIHCEGKQIYLGTFASAISAAIARDDHIIKNNINLPLNLPLRH